MSLYHQKNQFNEIDLLEEKREVEEEMLPCPECNQISMNRTRSDCTLMDGTFIPNLEYYYCSSCHSKFYDDAAMGKIELVRGKKK
jgi:uncharacterized protein with PIN domain